MSLWTGFFVRTEGKMENFVCRAVDKRGMFDYHINVKGKAGLMDCLGGGTLGPVFLWMGEEERREYPQRSGNSWR